MPSGGLNQFYESPRELSRLAERDGSLPLAVRPTYFSLAPIKRGKRVDYCRTTRGVPTYTGCRRPHKFSRVGVHRCSSNQDFHNASDLPPSCLGRVVVCCVSHAPIERHEDGKCLTERASEILTQNVR